MIAFRRATAILLITLCAVGSPISQAAEPSFRTWTSSSGSFTLDAQFVECRENFVVLRKRSDETIQVPLDRLSEADRMHVEQVQKRIADTETRTSPGQQGGGSTSGNGIGLVKAVEKCRLASDAVRLVNRILADPQITPFQKEEAERQLVLWKEREKAGLVRYGTEWLESKEIKARKEQAGELVREALDLIRKGEGDAGRKKLLAASKLAPDSLVPDFLLGIGYALTAKDWKAAETRFEVCLRRNPSHIPSLNNAALTRVRQGKYMEAISDWKEAMQLAPPQAEIVYNLRRLMANADRLSPSLPPSARKAVENAIVGIPEEAQRQRTGQDGWRYMGLSRIDIGGLLPTTRQRGKLATAENPIVGYGCGVIVHPGYILTARQVVECSESLLVASAFAPDQRFPATVERIGEQSSSDLALLRCDGITLPPSRMALDVPLALGEQVAILGSSGFGGTGEATRTLQGAITALPVEGDSTFAIKTKVTPSGIGAPIVSQSGCIVGIVGGESSGTSNGAEAIGIGTKRAVSFVRQSIPQLQPSAAAEKLSKGSVANERVGQSLVLILIASHPAEIELKTPHGALNLADPWCFVCAGRRTVDCPNRQCLSGVVRTVRFEKKVVNAEQGIFLVERFPDRAKCNTCNGKGVVGCPHCAGGLAR